MTNKNLEFMQAFFADSIASGGISNETNKAIEQLWKDYQLPELQENSSVITADVGFLGSLTIREIESFQPQSLKYESGNYDYVSIVVNKTTTILWTDYSNIEPYNRQGGLYADGSSFAMLGEPIVEKEDYREFIAIHEYKSNISFAIWGYNFNNYYKSIRFGICLKNEHVDEFVSKLRTLLGK